MQASPTIFSANVPEVKEQAPLNKRETTLEDVRRIIRGQHPGAYYVNVHASDDSANNVELEKRHWESNDTKRTNSSESSYLIGKGLRGLFNNLIDKTIGKLEDALVDGKCQPAILD